MSTWKFIFSGVGGQGMITAGILLGEAAVIHEGKFAVQTQSYGAEMRGGLSRADVTVSDHPSYYPKVEQAHVLVCMHQSAYTKNLGHIRPGGLLIVDSDQVKVGRHVDARRYILPISSTVREKLGTPRGTNMVALGVAVGLTDAVEPDSLRAAIGSRYGEGSTNEAAFELGLEFARSGAAGRAASLSGSAAGSGAVGGGAGRGGAGEGPSSQARP